MSFNQLIDSFSDKRVLIIGDVMLDTYIWGDVERVSPESPVPVVEANRKEHRLGGAANVALNVKELGAKPVLVSVVGNDDKGKQLVDLLEKNGLNSSEIIKASRVTTEKTRVLSRNQQMLRVDYETTEPIDDATGQEVSSRMMVHMEEADVVIFQDYDKGILLKNGIKAMLSSARAAGVPTVVDPKRKNFFNYTGCTLFKPNWRELSDALTVSSEEEPTEAQIHAHAIEISKHLENKITLITLSDKGIFYLDAQKHFLSPAYKPRQIADVSGAGDTVIAVAGLCLATQADPEAMCTIANTAAGLVCEKVGVVPVDASALRTALDINA